jgi:hypothetical protein
MKTTTRCVRCLKSAVVYTGYVLRGRRVVLAGWCRRCHSEHGHAFVGHHQKRMGLTEAT